MISATDNGFFLHPRRSWRPPSPGRGDARRIRGTVTLGGVGCMGWRHHADSGVNRVTVTTAATASPCLGGGDRHQHRAGDRRQAPRPSGCRRAAIPPRVNATGTPVTIRTDATAAGARALHRPGQRHRRRAAALAQRRHLCRKHGAIPAALLQRHGASRQPPHAQPDLCLGRLSRHGRRRWHQLALAGRRGGELMALPERTSNHDRADRLREEPARPFPDRTAAFLHRRLGRPWYRRHRYGRADRQPATATSYARQPVSFTGSGTRRNAASLRFGFTSAVGTLTHIGIFDALAGGNALAWAALVLRPRPAQAGSVTIPAESLTVLAD